MLSVEEESSELVRVIQELTTTSKSLLITSQQIVKAAAEASERARMIRESFPYGCHAASAPKTD